MSGCAAPPPDDATLPEAFRQALPPEPLFDQRLVASIEDALHAALAPRATPPRAAALVAAPRPVAAPAPVRPVAAAGRPDLKRLRSIEDKDERAGDDAGVHRSQFIRAVLQHVFHDNWPHSPDFQAWIEQAKALYRDGGAGRELARTPFMQLPPSRAVDAELRRRGPPTDGGLTWSILLGIVWGVWYCDDQERQRYRVQIGPLLHRGHEPELFDSAKLANTLDAAGAVRASAGAMGCIWVIDDLDAEHPSVYSHLCLLGRFHHSSLLGGADIGAGGDWIVEDGVITVIGGSSGHYRPARWRFEKALRFMRQRGAIGPRARVALFDAGKPLDVPALDFMDHPQAYPEPRFTTHKP